MMDLGVERKLLTLIPLKRKYLCLLSMFSLVKSMLSDHNVKDAFPVSSDKILLSSINRYWPLRHFCVFGSIGLNDTRAWMMTKSSSLKFWMSLTVINGALSVVIDFVWLNST